MQSLRVAVILAVVMGVVFLVARRGYWGYPQHLSDDDTGKIGAISMVSDDKQYEFYTKRIADLSDATQDGLKLFLPTFSAIVGGAIWLRNQASGTNVLSTYQHLSDGLVALLTFVCIMIVIYNVWAWWQFRDLLVRITKETAYPAPSPHWSETVIDGILCFAMAAACVIFWEFNPFSISK